VLSSSLEKGGHRRRENSASVDAVTMRYHDLLESEKWKGR